MISSKYLLWVGFSPLSDTGENQIKYSHLNQIHASQQTSSDLKYQNTVNAIKRE